MLQAQGGDARVMDRGSGDARLRHQCAKRGPVPVAFGQQHQGGTLEPGGDLCQRARHWGRWVVDARVSEDRKELVQAGPGDGPGRARFGALRQTGESGGMEGRTLAMRTDPQVGVDAILVPGRRRTGHAAAAKTRPQNCGRKPLPLVVTRRSRNGAAGLRCSPGTSLRPASTGARKLVFCSAATRLAPASRLSPGARL